MATDVDSESRRSAGRITSLCNRSDNAEAEPTDKRNGYILYWKSPYYRDEVEPLEDPNWLPLCQSPDRFIILVGGGVGRHSMYIPTFAASLSVTREIVA